jgi:hypothetical protein
MKKSDYIINNGNFRLIDTHYSGLAGNMRVGRKEEVFSPVNSMCRTYVSLASVK